MAGCKQTAFHELLCFAILNFCERVTSLVQINDVREVRKGKRKENGRGKVR
jgi:hypothetical protein